LRVNVPKRRTLFDIADSIKAIFAASRGLVTDMARTSRLVDGKRKKKLLIY